PLCEMAGRRAVGFRLAGIVDVGARPAGAGFTVGLEGLFQLLEEVGFGAEMAEVIVAPLGRIGHRDFHAGAVVAMKGVALDEGGGDVLAPEYLVEGVLNRR